jgi:hypothetical protein
MSVQAIIAAVFFVGLFITWVVLPSRLQKRHSNEEHETVD